MNTQQIGLQVVDSKGKRFSRHQLLAFELLSIDKSSFFPCTVKSDNLAHLRKGTELE